MTTEDIMQAIAERKAKYAAMRPFNVVKALERTRSSINAHIDRNGGVPSLNSNKAQELCDRYDDLRESLLVRCGDERWNAWLAYCESTGSDWRHNGHDLFS